MAGIVEKFIKLKTSIGGNREKTGYEDTFGMPKEEQAHITRPNKANNRIVSELEFALHVSQEDGGRYDGVLEQALDFIDTDELLEVTPKSLRIRKKILDSRMRKRSNQK